jgi:hypothetical protein
MNEFFPIELARQSARIDGNVDDLAFKLILKAAIEFVEDKTAFRLAFKQFINNELVSIDESGDGFVKYRPINNQVRLRFNGNVSQNIIVSRNKFTLNTSFEKSCGCDGLMREKSASAQYEAGFDCFDNAPAPVIMAVLKLVSWHYEKRGDDAIAKYTRSRSSNGASSLYDNRGFEFSGAAELCRPYMNVGIY